MAKSEKIKVSETKTTKPKKKRGERSLVVGGIGTILILLALLFFLMGGMGCCANLSILPATALSKEPARDEVKIEVTSPIRRVVAETGRARFELSTTPEPAALDPNTASATTVPIAPTEPATPVIPAEPAPPAAKPTEPITPTEIYPETIFPALNARHRILDRFLIGSTTFLVLERDGSVFIIAKDIPPGRERNAILSGNIDFVRIGDDREDIVLIGWREWKDKLLPVYSTPAGTGTIR
jgi:Na+-transporting methylmalonyl-CoA/oxaloacetate decarboxylase gamma subunit